MNKTEFLRALRSVYLTLNMADGGASAPEWMQGAPELAGVAGCFHLDHLLSDMMQVAVLTPEDVEAFHMGALD